MINPKHFFILFLVFLFSFSISQPNYLRYTFKELKLKVFCEKKYIKYVYEITIRNDANIPILIPLNFILPKNFLNRKQISIRIEKEKKYTVLPAIVEKNNYIELKSFSPLGELKPGEEAKLIITFEGVKPKSFLIDSYRLEINTYYVYTKKKYIEFENCNLVYFSSKLEGEKFKIRRDKEKTIVFLESNNPKIDIFFQISKVSFIPYLPFDARYFLILFPTFLLILAYIFKSITSTSYI